jgi:F0F1-type ATP synthase beta subunit
MNYEQLVSKALEGDIRAFVELTRRFQQFAFGTALAQVRDFQQAEDIVQEAFVTAWSALPTLAEPAAFPGWLRGIVRGIATSPVEDLPRGATVLNARRRSKAPINQTQLDRLLPLLTAAATESRPSNEIVETGIKVIDVMCPIRAGGSVAIAGEYRTGIPVVMEEIVRRISKGNHPVALFVLYPPPSEMWPPSLDKDYSIADELKRDGISEGTVGCVQTYFVGGTEGPWTAEKLANLAPVDTLIHLSHAMALRKAYPCVDVLTARSRLLDDCREILDGRHDDLPTDSFYFTGSIDEIRSAAAFS